MRTTLGPFPFLGNPYDRGVAHLVERELSKFQVTRSIRVARFKRLSSRAAAKTLPDYGAVKYRTVNRTGGPP